MRLYLFGEYEGLLCLGTDEVYNLTYPEEKNIEKAIDGSIYTIDGKELVRAKISKNGFVVPDETERIAEMIKNQKINCKEKNKWQAIIMQKEF